MRKVPWLLAEPFRLGGQYGDDFGAFRIPHKSTGVDLMVIASGGEVPGREYGDEWAWDHVSVSLRNRCPNWPEMAAVKDIFWDQTETVMQLHVPASDHLNLHPYCLHLWRPLLLDIPRPPSAAVAVPGTLEDNRRAFLRGAI